MIQADSKFTIIAEHLYAAAWRRVPRVAYCLSSLQLHTDLEQLVQAGSELLYTNNCSVPLALTG